MKAIIFTHGLNMSPRKAERAGDKLFGYCADNNIQIEVRYFDGNTGNLFSTQEKFDRFSKLFLHVDAFSEPSRLKIGQLAKKFEFIAFLEKDKFLDENGVEKELTKEIIEKNFNK